jgi:hypothetical protein
MLLARAIMITPTLAETAILQIAPLFVYLIYHADPTPVRPVRACGDKVARPRLVTILWLVMGIYMQSKC